MNRKQTSNIFDRIADFRERSEDWKHHERWLAAANEALSLIDELERELRIVAEDRNSNWSFGEKLAAENEKLIAENERLQKNQ